MTKVYQSITRPVQYVTTVNDSRFRNPRVMEYGVKNELRKFYVYIRKPNDGKGWVKRHGPFVYLQEAIKLIHDIKEETLRLCQQHELNIVNAKKEKRPSTSILEEELSKKSGS